MPYFLVVPLRLIPLSLSRTRYGQIRSPFGREVEGTFSRTNTVVRLG